MITIPADFDVNAFAADVFELVGVTLIPLGVYIGYFIIRDMIFESTRWGNKDEG